MGQHKNSTQMDIFVKFMEKHQDLARGFVKGDRVHCEQLWAELVLELNASGPPTKDVPGWKKVWVNMKLSVKHRMAHNRACAKTGGGCFNKYILSPTDELVANICGLYASVDGRPNTRNFVVPSNENKSTSSNIPPTIVPDSLKNVNNKDTGDKTRPSSLSPSSSPLQNQDPVTPSTPAQTRKRRRGDSVTPSTPAQNRKRRRDVCDIGDVLEMEAEHYSKIEKSLDSIKKEMKENRSSLKEVSRNKREIKKIKEKELQEMIRHNYEMEKSAKTKNELKLKFLELEQIKLGIQPSSP